MKLKFTLRAERDLEAISDYIARDNPRRALSFVRDLRRRCRAIVDFPEAAILRSDIADGVRVAVHSSYLILYSFQEGELIIERIVHGARHLRQRIGPESD